VSTSHPPFLAELINHASADGAADKSRQWYAKTMINLLSKPGLPYLAEVWASAAGLLAVGV
jgi:hypothetical protein